MMIDFSGGKNTIFFGDFFELCEFNGSYGLRRCYSPVPSISIDSERWVESVRMSASSRLIS